MFRINAGFAGNQVVFPVSAVYLNFQFEFRGITLSAEVSGQRNGRFDFGLKWLADKPIQKCQRFDQSGFTAGIGADDCQNFAELRACRGYERAVVIRRVFVQRQWNMDLLVEGLKVADGKRLQHDEPNSITYNYLFNWQFKTDNTGLKSKFQRFIVNYGIKQGFSCGN